MRGLYAIVDVMTVQRHGLEVVPFAAAVLAGQPAVLQLRDKRRRTRETLRLLRALRPLAHQAGVLLLANDRADLAALADCDGVHLGRQDLPAPLARRLLGAAGKPAAVIGVSAHDEAELTQSLGEDPDYVALGPVFGTQTKADSEPTIGLGGLATLIASARQRQSGLPCVAIGGITIANAAEVAQLCPCCAVISALVPDTSRGGDAYAAVTERTKALQKALR